MTTKEAAKIAGVTDKTIRNWIGAGRLHPSRPGSGGESKRGSPLRISIIELRALLLAGYEAKPEPPKDGDE